MSGAKIDAMENARVEDPYREGIHQFREGENIRCMLGIIGEGQNLCKAYYAKTENSRSGAEAACRPKTSGLFFAKIFIPELEMRQTTEGQVRLGSSRTGAAKKFADWPIRMPGGKDATFTVTFEEDEGSLIFKATSDHAWFKDVMLSSGDPNALKLQIEELAQARIERERNGNWAAGTLVKIETTRRRDRDYPRGSLEFRMDLEEIEFLHAEPVGNRGQTPIRGEFRQEVIFQRGPEDQFSNGIDEAKSLRLSGSILDPETAAFWNDPIRHESDKPMTRVIAPGDGAEIEVLTDTIERFLRNFGARMAPARRSLEGTPAPEELVELMRQSLPEA